MDSMSDISMLQYSCFTQYQALKTTECLLELPEISWYRANTKLESTVYLLAPEC